MRKLNQLLNLFAFILISFVGSGQANNTSYYYRGQQVPVTLSEKDMFIKFLPGTSNATKQALITQAQVDLIGSDWNDMPELVQLRSRVIMQLVWIYPCPIYPDKSQQYNDSAKKASQLLIGKCTPPCPPPNCDPYQAWVEHDNFYDALFFFLDDVNVRSGSKAVLRNGKMTATCEDFFIKIKPGFTIADFSSLLSYYSLTATDASAEFGTGVYKISETRGGSRFCIERAALFYATGYCDFSHPNFYDRGAGLTNDPKWNEQWNLKNTGQHNGTVGADIRIEQAWNFTRGSGIKVAVIDDGVQMYHPDIQANFLVGYDAVNNTTPGGDFTHPNESHGTKVSGIIAAIADNNRDITGVAPDSRIIPIRAFSDARQQGSDESKARAIRWAWQHGADVINCSWRTSFQSDLIDFAIHEATIYGRNGNGTTIVFASGNEGSPNMEYPAELEDVIAVGNMSMCNTRVNPSSCDNLGGMSSFGPNLDVMAPGAKIPTLDLISTNTLFSGTSAAAPHVSGTVALMLAANPNLVVDQIKTMLYYSCNKVGGYCYNWTPAHPNGAWHMEMGYGRINAYNAVQLALRATSFGPPVYDIPQQNHVMTGSTGFILINTGSCTSLASAWYSADRYEVTTNIVYPYTNNPLIICSSNGWSGANPNDGKYFATAINVTNTSATLKTWVYKLWSANYQYLGWYPTAPENIKFNYTVITCNSGIDYQTSKGVTKTVSGPVPFEFDYPGPANDQQINPKEGSDGVIIYPNPTSGNFRVIHNFPEGEEITRMELMNNTGRRLRVLPAHNKLSPGTEVDVSEFGPGIYMLRILTTKGVYTKKIVRQ